MKNAEYPETAGRVPSDDVMVPSSPGESTTPSDGACAQSRPAAPLIAEGIADALKNLRPNPELFEQLRDLSTADRLTSWAPEELNAWYNERLRDADVNMGVIVRQQWELAAQLEDYRNLSFREAVCTPSRSRYIVPAHSYTRATLQGIIVGAVLAASIAGFWYAVYQVARAWL
jgi:hypothetical protein